MSKPEEKAKVAAANAVSGIDYAADAGDGFSGIGQDDLSIPFLSILQSGSPEVKEEDPKYIKGATPGMVINTVTKELLEARASKNASITVIPCGYMKRWVEWKPKNAGGGFVKAHETDEILKQTKKGTGQQQNKDFLPNGNIIETTAYHSVMLVRGKSVVAAIIALKSTGLKYSRKWNTNQTNIRMVNPTTGKEFMPPMYAFTWHLSTRPEVRDGNTWFSFTDIVKGDLVTDTDIFGESKQLAKSVKDNSLALPAPENTDPALDNDAY